MAPTISPTRPGEVVLRDGKPYTHCEPCEGTGQATQAGEPFCAECFGAGIAPIFEAARFAFARTQSAGEFAPSVDAPHSGGKMEQSQPTARPSTLGATQPQIDLLERLIRERMPHADSLDEIQRGFCRDGLNTLRSIADGKVVARKTMSDIIDEVMQVKVPRTADATRVRTNRHPGTCRNCGQHIAAEAGSLLNINGAWVVEHIGECPEAPVVKTEVEIRTEQVIAQHAETDLDLSGLLPGRYGIPGSDSRLKLSVGHGKGDFEGWITVSDAAVYGMGSEYGVQMPDSLYRGKVADALQAILADPYGASARYGQLTETCGVCGRALENEESVARGIGPWCMTKF